MAVADSEATEPLASHPEAAAPAEQSRRDAVRAWLREQFSKRAFVAVLHVLLLLVAVILLRPLFARSISASFYEAPSITWRVVSHDLDVFKVAAQRHRPGAPDFLFLLIPTAAFWFTKRRLRWTDWDHGKALRWLVMGLLLILVWSGAGSEYNVYLMRAHALDRLLLIGLTIACWYTPLAVPFATRLAVIMIRESYVPIAQDDFEFRPVAEVLIVFSAFAWLSLKKSFQPKHFLLVAMGAWASYYFSAGVAKWNYGPEHSWLLENHLSNLAASAHVRGWLSFVPSDTYLAVVGFFGKFDLTLAVVTLIIEFGSLIFFFTHWKLTRWWFLMNFALHLGIFVFSGICFWKWGLACLLFFFWLGRGGGQATIKALCRYKLVLLLGILSVAYSRNRIWYSPQNGVAWYDTRLIDNYELYVVGPSGKRYLFDPSDFAPMDMHWVQGRLCYATDHERRITGIYGVTGSLSVLKKLETFEKPEQALALHRRGGRCRNGRRSKARRKLFDMFLKRYFGNLNRHGRPHRWLSVIARPHHIWIQPQGTIYELQERAVALELWRTTVYHHGGKYHELEKKLARTLPLE